MKIKYGIADLIDEAILKECSERDHRDYMGASGIGEECDRKLWYSYKKPKPVSDARLQRIFDSGNMYEDYVVSLLKKAGLTVWETDSRGEQFGFVDGKIAGHWDGVVQGLPESNKPHLLEIKSAKDSSYKKFIKDGLEKTNKKYWVQIHTYMKKAELEDGLFIVINKDTQELYFERVKYKAIVADHHLLRAKEIASSNEMPERRYTKSTFFKCKWCDWREECWNLNNGN